MFSNKRVAEAISLASPVEPRAGPPSARSRSSPKQPPKGKEGQQEDSSPIKNGSSSSASGGGKPRSSSCIAKPKGGGVAPASRSSSGSSTPTSSGPAYPYPMSFKTEWGGVNVATSRSSSSTSSHLPVKNINKIKAPGQTTISIAASAPGSTLTSKMKTSTASFLAIERETPAFGTRKASTTSQLIRAGGSKKLLPRPVLAKTTVAGTTTAGKIIASDAAASISAAAFASNPAPAVSLAAPPPLEVSSSKVPAPLTLASAGRSRSSGTNSSKLSKSSSEDASVETTDMNTVSGGGVVGSSVTSSTGSKNPVAVEPFPFPAPPAPSDDAARIRAAIAFSSCAAEAAAAADSTSCFGLGFAPVGGPAGGALLTTGAAPALLYYTDPAGGGGTSEAEPGGNPPNSAPPNSASGATATVVEGVETGGRRQMGFVDANEHLLETQQHIHALRVEREAAEEKEQKDTTGILPPAHRQSSIVIGGAIPAEGVNGSDPILGHLHHIGTDTTLLGDRHYLPAPPPGILPAGQYVTTPELALQPSPAMAGVISNSTNIFPAHQQLAPPTGSPAYSPHYVPTPAMLTPTSAGISGRAPGTQVGAGYSTLSLMSSEKDPSSSAPTSSQQHIEIIRTAKTAIEKYIGWEKDNGKFLLHKLREQEQRFATVEEAHRARDELRLNLFRFLDSDLPQRVGLVKDLQRGFNALAVECSRARADTGRLKALLSESHSVYKHQQVEIEKLRQASDAQVAHLEQRLVGLTTVNTALQAKAETLMADGGRKAQDYEEEKKEAKLQFAREIEAIQVRLEAQVAASKEAFFQEQAANTEKLQMEAEKYAEKIAEVEGRIAEERKEIQEERHKMEEEVTNYVMERDNLSGQTRELNEEIERLTKRLDEHVQMVSIKEDELGSVRRALADLETTKGVQVSTFSQELALLTQERASFTSQLADMEKKMLELETEKATNLDKIQKIESERLEQSKREETTLRQATENAAELASLRLRNEELQNSVNTLTETLKQTGEDLTAEKESHGNMRKKHGDTESERSVLEKDLALAERTKDELTTVLTQMKELNTEMTATLKTKEDELARIHKDLDGVKAESAEQHSELENLKHSEEIHVEEIARLTVECESLKAEKQATIATQKDAHSSELQKLQEDAKDKANGLRQQIMALQEQCEARSREMEAKHALYSNEKVEWVSERKSLIAERDSARIEASECQTMKQLAASLDQQLADTRALLAERQRTDSLRKSAIGQLLQTMQDQDVVDTDSMIGAGDRDGSMVQYGGGTRPSSASPMRRTSTGGVGGGAMMTTGAPGALVVDRSIQDSAEDAPINAAAAGAAAPIAIGASSGVNIASISASAAAPTTVAAAGTNAGLTNSFGFDTSASPDRAGGPTPGGAESAAQQVPSGQPPQMHFYPENLGIASSTLTVVGDEFRLVHVGHEQDQHQQRIEVGNGKVVEHFDVNNKKDEIAYNSSSSTSPAFFRQYQEVQRLPEQPRSQHPHPVATVPAPGGPSAESSYSEAASDRFIEDSTSTTSASILAQRLLYQNSAAAAPSVTDADAPGNVLLRGRPHEYATQQLPQESRSYATHQSSVQEPPNRIDPAPADQSTLLTQRMVAARNQYLSAMQEVNVLEMQQQRISGRRHSWNATSPDLQVLQQDMSNHGHGAAAGGPPNFQQHTSPSGAPSAHLQVYTTSGGHNNYGDINGHGHYAGSQSVQMSYRSIQQLPNHVSSGVHQQQQNSLSKATVLSAGEYSLGQYSVPSDCPETAPRRPATSGTVSSSFQRSHGYLGKQNPAEDDLMGSRRRVRSSSYGSSSQRGGTSTSRTSSRNPPTTGDRDRKLVDPKLLARMRAERKASIERAMARHQRDQGHGSVEEGGQLSGSGGGIFATTPLEPPKGFFDWFM
ncbi:unnamed protein product [Amoebophrya sp. A25]|nr:unnamed protein product [Amoebophrya sp. A25]|eukprot:GSA25T00017075001.1